MGYVDEANSYLGRFRVARHFRKRAYLKIFVNLVNIVATNSWVQHRRDSDLNGIEKKHQLSLYDFKASLAESLCRARTTHLARQSRAPVQKRPRSGPKAMMPPEDVRLDGLAHWPVGMGSENRGANCKVPGCKAKPVTKCKNCEVHLCISTNNCFKTFHTVSRLGADLTAEQ